MQKHIIYGVIVDVDTSQIAKIECNYGIDQLRKSKNGMLKELIEMLSEQHESWNDVLNGTRAAVLFDGESVDSIRINSGTIRFQINRK